MNILDNVTSKSNEILKKNFFFFLLFRVMKEENEEKMSPKSEEIKNEESSYVSFLISIVL